MSLVIHFLPELATINRQTFWRWWLPNTNLCTNGILWTQQEMSFLTLVDNNLPKGCGAKGCFAVLDARRGLAQNRFTPNNTHFYATWLC